MTELRSPHPRVQLRSPRGTSISAVIYALVERGVLLRPALASELRASVLMRLGQQVATYMIAPEAKNSGAVAVVFITCSTRPNTRCHCGPCPCAPRIHDHLIGSA